MSPNKSKLAVLRKKAKLTQTALAQSLGITQSQVSKYEADGEIPDRLLRAWSSSIGCTIEELESTLDKEEVIFNSGQYGSPKYNSLKKDDQSYSEDNFWKKLKNYAIDAGREVVETALKLYYAAQSPETPMSAKTGIYAALTYFILPIDLISDFLPGVGYVDDLSLLASTVAAVTAYITPEVEEKARRKAAEWFGDGENA